MKKKSGFSSGITIILAFLTIVFFLNIFYGRDKNSGSTTKDSGNRSSYWYDDSATQKQKAVDTLKKYYNVDKDGHITGQKRGSIRNGKVVQ
jgi:hypothetical protein